MSRAFALMLALLAGCPNRFIIDSHPAGARVTVNGRNLGPAPVETTLAWWPWRPMRAELKLTGYRPVVINLQRDVGPFRLLGELLTGRFKRLVGRAARVRHEVVLVVDHGPVGTWTPQEAEKRAD